jgi:AcrR family transcriptional regulator
LAQKSKRAKTDALIERRRSQIADAATKLFARSGFHNTTMQTVAEVAGISVGNIYNYFADKNDLLYFIICRILDAYNQEIPAAARRGLTPLERFKSGILAYARVIDRNKTAALLGYRDSYSLRGVRLKEIMRREVETNNLISELIKDCVADGTFRQVGVAMFTYQIVVFVHSWALEAWRLPRGITIDAFVDEGLRLILRGALNSFDAQDRQPSSGDALDRKNGSATASRRRKKNDFQVEDR